MDNVHKHSDSECFSMSLIASVSSHVFSLSRRQLLIPTIKYLEDCSVITIEYHMSINCIKVPKVFMLQTEVQFTCPQADFIKQPPIDVKHKRNDITLKGSIFHVS
jgi:hypothetical protein